MWLRQDCNRRADRDGAEEFAHVAIVERNAPESPVPVRSAPVDENFASQRRVPWRRRFPAYGAFNPPALRSGDSPILQAFCRVLFVRVAQTEREIVAAVGIPAADVVASFRRAPVALFALVSLRAEPEPYPVGADDCAAGIERQDTFSFADQYSGFSQRKSQLPFGLLSCTNCTGECLCAIAASGCQDDIGNHEGCRGESDEIEESFWSVHNAAPHLICSTDFFGRIGV